MLTACLKHEGCHQKNRGVVFRFHALTDYIEGKTTRSYAIRMKLSSLCNCDCWTKM